MDPRVEKAVLSKIAEIAQAADEIGAIQRRTSCTSPQDLALGIAIGRIYNSFHYQTRRILGRSATEDEFSEFLDLLAHHIDAIRRQVTQ
ncbi:MAG: hypothetical protein C4292_06970 [Nitrososphaera sp.]